MACVVYRTDLVAGRAYPLAELFTVLPDHDPAPGWFTLDFNPAVGFEQGDLPLVRWCTACRLVYVPEQR